MVELDIFQKLGLEYAPVGIKFEMTRPKELPRLDKKLAFCEMLREAQRSDAGFYASADDHCCGVGPYVLGQAEAAPEMVSGQIGPHIGVYDDARANRQIYLRMPRFARDTAPYTWFHRLDGITFDPDLVILTARPSQAEIILRAYGYHSGRGWQAKGTSVAGCAYLYAYPYLSGELNVMVTGLHHGMRVRGLLPEGWLLLSIPFQTLPEILRNLSEMQWELPQYTWGREYHMQYMKAVGQKIKNKIEE